MSWTNELYQIYEKYSGKDDAVTLLPISHSTANAQVEVTLREDGELLDAVRISDKSDAVTIIPVTEDSGTRGFGVAPHPLEDKLVYLCGDYKEYTTGKRNDNGLYYRAFMDQLHAWKESAYTHPAVNAIYTYLDKGCLMQDLILKGVLVIDEESGRLKEKEKILGIAQEDCFVRFRIIYQDLTYPESRVWKNHILYQKFISYNSSTAGREQLCYATGKILPATYKHPSKIRNPGDKAKLISSNDESGFSYRGRFDSKEQALSVSYEVSQKIHNALKWLIARQKVALGSMTMVMWESSLNNLPNILNAPEKMRKDEEDIDDEWINFDEEEDMLISYRSWLKKKIWGIGYELNPDSKAMIMVLDAATPGRLAMSLYEEMRTSEMYQNLEKWHADTAWYKFDWKKKKRYIGSFSLIEIAECAFGTEQGDFITCKPEVKIETILRLIPCVINRQNVPADIINNLFNKAVNPLAYDHIYNWRRVLEITCGLIRKRILEEKHRKKEEEECKMALDKSCRDRDYLYGRLLAIAEAAETSAFEKGEGRITNAGRYFESFSNRPYQTWGVLYNRLVPYLNKMNPGQRVFYERLIGEVKELFDKDDFMDNKKLSPEFLLAYHCQLNAIFSKKSNTKEEETL